MRRTLSNITFAAGTCAAILAVEGPVTNRNGFAATFDQMFALWVNTVMGPMVASVNGLVEPGSSRDEMYIRAVSQRVSIELGGNTVAATVTFTTDVKDLDELSVTSVVLPQLSYVQSVLLKAFTRSMSLGRRSGMSRAMGAVALNGYGIMNGSHASVFMQAPTTEGKSSE